MGRKEYEKKEQSTGPNSAKYHSSSVSFKQEHKAEEQNAKDKFKNSAT